MCTYMCVCVCVCIGDAGIKWWSLSFWFRILPTFLNRCVCVYTNAFVSCPLTAPFLDNVFIMCLFIMCSYLFDNEER